MKLTVGTIRDFQRTVYDHFKRHGRHRLPWRRRDCTPYHIFISEIMLQQTQVDRVAEKFIQFTERFPDFRALARAPLAAVLQQWQGLGYNRRALYLHKSAQIIMNEHAGVLPDDPAVLETFPGIGAATAASICAFGFNKPTLFIETNIRSVFIHHFFNDETAVPDEQIRCLVEQTLDRQHAMRWYSALMDYGVYLKKEHGNPSRKSKHHVKQSKFEGSDRQIRGQIVRVLTKHARLCAKDLTALIDRAGPERVLKVADGLVRDGLITQRRGYFYVGAQ